ncbi:hypothetical protein BDZ97DRAFT_1757420 [Flammula alnicola]|nr:hypothetical protein BDZ97DRAFT_1757420 [Flammula alnicola]
MKYREKLRSLLEVDRRNHASYLKVVPSNLPSIIFPFHSFKQRDPAVISKFLINSWADRPPPDAQTGATDAFNSTERVHRTIIADRRNFRSTLMPEAGETGTPPGTTDRAPAIPEGHKTRGKEVTHALASGSDCDLDEPLRCGVLGRLGDLCVHFPPLFRRRPIMGKRRTSMGHQKIPNTFGAQNPNSAEPQSG